MSSSTKIEHCAFTYRCPKTWDALYATNIDSVRFCDQCNRNVFLSKSTGEAKARAAAGQCVAIPIKLSHQSEQRLSQDHLMVGILKPPPYSVTDRLELQHQYGQGHSRWLGLDGCPAGWFYVGIDDSNDFHFGVMRGIAEITPRLETAELALIDIPVGLLSSGGPGRDCEAAARKALGRRASSVFPVPARSALSMPSYATGCAENFKRLGRKLSRQTWAIAAKIREVDQYLLLHRTNRLREMHPEVAFWALNGRQAMQYSKKKPEGHEERLAVLERFFPRAAECFGLARQAYLKKEVASDDITDALVGAVTAMQSPGLATFPRERVLDDQGLPMEMVFADL